MVVLVQCNLIEEYSVFTVLTCHLVTGKKMMNASKLCETAAFGFFSARGCLSCLILGLLDAGYFGNKCLQCVFKINTLFMT